MEPYKNKYRYAHALLSAMCISYLIPIALVYYYYTSNEHNNSISSILSHPSANLPIMISMAAMGCFTMMYELYRNDYVSASLIGLLLIGIYGILWIDETHGVHFSFAFLIFLSIIGFMIHHCIRISCPYLYCFLAIQLVLCIAVLYTLYNTSPYLFHVETILVINFALYYLYLHYVSM